VTNYSGVGSGVGTNNFLGVDLVVDFFFVFIDFLRPNGSKSTFPTRGIIALVAHVISDLVSICSVTF
jgi:hypothetical protein